jgi:acetylornithine deacetylase/succinyl-diaminopimelate desuccinylase-like protein
VEAFDVPAAEVHAAGLQTITNLIVRRRYGDGGPTIALNAHGDVVPPGEGWTHDPYGGEVVDGLLYGRASAVSKSDFASFSHAVRALEAVARPKRGCIELHFTYDEEFGGELGPGWLLRHGHTRPDLMIAAGFSHQVVTAHNGCLQLEVTVQGDMAHAAIPDTGTDALQGAVHILNVLYRLNRDYLATTSLVEGITHPYLNIGRIEGGTNTNVVPGKVVFKLDRRMIPEEDAAQVEADLRATIAQAAASFAPPRGGRAVQVDVRRLLLAQAMKPLPGNRPLVAALQKHGKAVFGEAIPAVGTPLYTDVRLYAERGIPGVIYGAGPRTVRESNAKRADEHVALSDLLGATQVLARTLHDLLA